MHCFFIAGNNMKTYDDTKITFFRSLHGNDVSVLPKSAFVDLGMITHIGVGSNPLYCDCNLRWFSDWIKGTAR